MASCLRGPKTCHKKRRAGAGGPISRLDGKFGYRWKSFDVEGGVSEGSNAHVLDHRTRFEIENHEAAVFVANSEHVVLDAYTR